MAWPSRITSPDPRETSGKPGQVMLGWMGSANVIDRSLIPRAAIPSRSPSYSDRRTGHVRCGFQFVEASAAKPAGAAARAEVLLLGPELGRRLLERPRRLRPREEIDVHPANPARSKLDVAR